MPPAVVWKSCNRDGEYILWLKEQVFSNHLIVERLVLAVHTPDLNAFRMVCRSWYMASLERFQKDATICLLAFVPDEEYGKGKTLDYETRLNARRALGIPVLSIQELSSALEAGRKVFDLKEKLSFQNYKIKHGSLDYPSYKRYDSSVDAHFYREHNPDPFWNEFGLKMRRLTVEDCRLGKRFLFNLLRDKFYAINVESLVLNCVHLKGLIWARYGLPTTLPFEFLNFVDDRVFDSWTPKPKLRHLKIQGYFATVNLKYMLPYFNDLREISMETTDCLTTRRDNALMTGFYDCNLGEYPPIPYLPLDKSYIGIFSLNHPKLESLSLHLEPDVSDHTVKTLLNMYSDRLKTLKLSRYPFRNSPSFDNFICTNTTLLKLTQLHLTGNVTNNFNFLLFAPTLLTLVIDLDFPPCFRLCHKLSPLLMDFYTPFSGEMVEASTQLLQYSEPPFIHHNLQHLEIDMRFDFASLTTLAKWMPNISTLKTILNSDTLAHACHLWPRLEYLKLLFGSAVDDAGLASVQLPKDLRHFELKNLCDQPKLTDVSAQLVFLKMAKLSSLSICTAEMTGEAIENLEWSISYVRIGSHSTSSGLLECCNYFRFLQKIGRPQ